MNQEVQRFSKEVRAAIKKMENEMVHSLDDISLELSRAVGF